MPFMVRNSNEASEQEAAATLSTQLYNAAFGQGVRFNMIRSYNGGSDCPGTHESPPTTPISPVPGARGHKLESSYAGL